jgi:hypothetical protein
VNNITIEKNQIVFLIDLRVPMISKDERVNDNSYLSDDKSENN